MQTAKTIDKMYFLIIDNYPYFLLSKWIFEIVNIITRCFIQHFRSMTLLSQVEIKLEDVEVLHLFILHLAGYDEYVKRTNEMFTLVNIERNLSKPILPSVRNII